MSIVTFVPHPKDTRIPNEWPERLLGDGFIELKLWDDFGNEGVYRDNVHDEYSLFDPSASEWNVEVRED